MGCAVIRTGNGHHTLKVVIDEAKLDAVAAALGIPLDQRRQLIANAEAIYIYRGTFQTPSAQPRPPSGRATRSAAGVARRQRK